MEVTPFGIVILVNELQPSNAEEPMEVTPFEIVILVNELQFLNAEEPIESPPVIITSFKDDGTQLELNEDEFAPNIYSKRVLLVPPNSAPTNGIVIVVKELQPENA